MDPAGQRTAAQKGEQQKQMPGGAHRLVDQTVGFFVPDEHLSLRIETQLPSQLESDDSQVDYRARAVAILFVQCELHARSDRFVEIGLLRLGIGQARCFLFEIVYIRSESPEQFSVGALQIGCILIPLLSVEDNLAAVGVFH